GATLSSAPPGVWTRRRCPGCGNVLRRYGASRPSRLCGASKIPGIAGGLGSPGLISVPRHVEGRNLVTDTPNLPSGDLSSLKVAQLQQIAAELGIKGARRMRKSELIDALRAGQGDQRPRSQAEERPAPEPAARSQLQLDLPAAPDGAGADDDGQQGRQPQERGAGRENEADQASTDRAGGPEAAQPDRGGDGRQDRHSQDRGDGHRDQGRDRTEQPDRARGGRQDQKQGEKRGQQPADRGPKGDKA